MALKRPLAYGTLTQRFGPSALSIEPSMWYSATRRAYWNPYPGAKFSTNVHAGVDFAGRPEGSPLLAAERGIVTRSDYDKYNGGGNVVEVEIRPNVRYAYNHCKARLVKVGDRVTRGQKIATLGCTGTIWTGTQYVPSCYGTHVHVNLTIREKLSDGIVRTMLYDFSDFMEGGSREDSSRVKPI